VKGPKKRPTKRVKGKVGTYGVAYLQYLPNGIANVQGPSSGLSFPLHTRVALDGLPWNATWSFVRIPELKPLADGFVDEMRGGGWKRGFVKANDAVRAQELRKQSMGGSNIFNGVNIGLFMSHGNFGTELDYTAEASQTLQTYFPIWTSTNNAFDWLRMSAFDFGSSATNGLRWMAILACNALRDQNYQSMNNRGVLPINQNLHLLCSTKTYAPSAPDIGRYWARRMTFGTYSLGPQTVRRSWFLGGSEGYKNTVGITNTVHFRVAGWEECLEDKLLDYSSPGGDLLVRDQQVYPTVPVP
jgi:hypothetical protein